MRYDRHGLKFTGLAGLAGTTLLWLVGLILSLGLPESQLTAGLCDRWEFTPFFISHWQSRCTALTAGNLPAVRAVQGDCGRVYHAARSLRSKPGETIARCRLLLWHWDGMVTVVTAYNTSGLHFRWGWKGALTTFWFCIKLVLKKPVLSLFRYLSTSRQRSCKINLETF